MDDNGESLYFRTMERLSMMLGPKTEPTREHIIALANEIEDYRKKISELNCYIHSLEAANRATTTKSAPMPAEVLENQRFKDAIVAQFLAKYAPNGR